MRSSYLLQDALDLQRKGKHADALALLTSQDSVAIRGPDAVVLKMLTAISARLTGDIELARQSEEYVDVDGSEPGSIPDQKWLIDFAQFFFLKGDLDNALKMATAHIRTFEGDGFAFGRIGVMLALQENLDGARTYLERAVALSPDRYEWHNNLAGVYMRLNMVEDALSSYDAALSINPEAIQTKQNRAIALKALGDSEAIVDQARADYDTDPESVPRTRALARAYALDHQPVRAVKLLAEKLLPLTELKRLKENGSESASQAKPQLYSNVACFEDQLALRDTLLRIFVDKDAFLRAIAVVDEILELQPKVTAEYLDIKIRSLISAGKRSAARELIDSLKAEQLEAPKTFLAAADAFLLCEEGKHEAGERIQRELLKKFPHDIVVKQQLAQILLWRGNLDEAYDLFEEVAKISPLALVNIMATKRAPSDPAAIIKMERFADNLLLPRQARSAMAFAAGDLLDAAGEADRAFSRYELANDLVNEDISWSEDAAKRKVTQLKTVFSREYLDALPSIRPPDRTPIFIVGMPRSGTTLLEQMLSAHPKVFGAGEQHLIPQLPRLLKILLKKQTQWPFELQDFTAPLREEAARYYLYGIAQLNSDAPYFVDKMPHNFLNLGLIYCLFPTAKIVAIERDPRDIAISNYQQYFSSSNGGLGYAFSLSNIAGEINRYYEMMGHWADNLPAEVFSVRYEDLIEDQQLVLGELLQFIGLDYVDELLQFYKSNRPVKTASVAQIRSGIYKTSVKKWQRYEHHLTEFLNTLNPTILETWGGS